MVVNDFHTKKSEDPQSAFDCRLTIRREPTRKSTVQKKCGNKVANENWGGPKWESVVLQFSRSTVRKDYARN